MFRPEDIAISGCIVTVSSEGRMQLVQGLVRPDDMPAGNADTTSAGDHHDSGEADDQSGISGSRRKWCRDRSCAASVIAGVRRGALKGPAFTLSG